MQQVTLLIPWRQENWYRRCDRQENIRMLSLYKINNTGIPYNISDHIYIISLHLIPNFYKLYCTSFIIQHFFILIAIQFHHLSYTFCNLFSMTLSAIPTSETIIYWDLWRNCNFLIFISLYSFLWLLVSMTESIEKKYQSNSILIYKW